MPQSSSEDGPRFPLQVTAGDLAAEIFVIDARLRLVARDVGRLSKNLPAGIYKINLRLGNQAAEHLVELTAPGLEKHFPALEFASPVPMPRTTSANQGHLDAAKKASREHHDRIGSGSSILVMARVAGEAPAGAPTVAVPDNFLTGLQLWPARGAQPVVDLANLSARHGGIGPQCATTSLEVDPGDYVLALRIGEMELRRTLHASRDWQTQVFLPMRGYPPAAGTISDVYRVDLERGAVLMGRPGGTDFEGEHARWGELARLALSEQRRIARGQLLEVLEYKVDDPLLGILGGHLLLMETTPDYRLLTTVVGNLLNRLHQEDHPDVAALALALKTPPQRYAERPYVFSHPPMLRRSWALILEASVQRPELVPPGSLTAAAAGRLWGSEPWLIWRGDESDEVRDRRFGAAMEAVRKSQASFGEPADVNVETLVRNLGLPRMQVEALLARTPKTDGH